MLCGRCRKLTRRECEGRWHCILCMQHESMLESGVVANSRLMPWGCVCLRPLLQRLQQCLASRFTVTLFGRPIDRRVTLVFCRPDKSIVRAVIIFLWQVVAAGLHISEGM